MECLAELKTVRRGPPWEVLWPSIREITWGIPQRGHQGNKRPDLPRSPAVISPLDQLEAKKQRNHLMGSKQTHLPGQGGPYGRMSLEGQKKKGTWTQHWPASRREHTEGGQEASGRGSAYEQNLHLPQYSPGKWRTWGLRSYKRSSRSGVPKLLSDHRQH